MKKLNIDCQVCYFSISQSDKAIYHLKNAKKLNKDYHFILNELFPKLPTKIDSKYISILVSFCYNYIFAQEIYTHEKETLKIIS